MSSRAPFRDPQLETELMLIGLVPRAARVAIEDLEAYTHRPLAELAAAYWRSRTTDDREAQDRVASAVDEATVLDYYRSTAQYLYELTYVAGSIKRQGWLRVLAHACRRFGCRRVLDVGGGIGSVSLSLSRRGITCEHLDVPGKTFDYAAWRFRRHGLSVPTHAATAEWPSGPYDAIIAWDVLEHLKDLEEKVARISQRLRAGGVLLHWSTFTQDEGVHLPENHVYGDVRRFDQLLQRHGFRFRGQLKPDRLSQLLRTLGWKSATLGIRLGPRLKYSGCFLIHERLDDATLQAKTCEAEHPCASS